MIASDALETALQRLTFHYRAIPRGLWLVALLRARQLGASTVVVHLVAAQHAADDGELDLCGVTAPEYDLLGLIQECGRLALDVLIQLDLAASPEAGRTPAASEPEARVMHPAARGWANAIVQQLAPFQHYARPRVRLQLYPGSAQAADWLRDAGWPAPFSDPLPAFPEGTHMPGALAAAVDPVLAVQAVPPQAALLRSDGSPRPTFWRVRSLRSVLTVLPGDFATARIPAELALLIDGASPPVFETVIATLTATNVAFAFLDITTATPAQLAAYKLVAVPTELTHHPLAAQLLAPASNLALLGPPEHTPAAGFFYKPRLPYPLGAEQLYETLEALGGNARYAWADSDGLLLQVRYSAEHIYLFIDNQRSTGYSGTLAYRAADGAVLHVQVMIGAGRSGVLLLRDDELLGAAIDGDGSEGGWLARGLHTSIVFSNGSGGIVHCMTALVASAVQSGRFQLRSHHPWVPMQAFRLLLDGTLLAATATMEGSHLSMPYVAEDQHGQTDCYIVMPESALLPPQLCSFLHMLLYARAAVLEAAAELAAQVGMGGAATAFVQIANLLSAAVPQMTTLAAYADVRQHADTATRRALADLDSAAPGTNIQTVQARAQIYTLVYAAG